MLVTAEQVKDAIPDPNAMVVDVRRLTEFTGEEVRAARGGRVPGAVRVFWQDVLKWGGDRTFRSPSEIRALLAEAGVTPDKRAITYCQGAVRAAHTALVLRMLTPSDEPYEQLEQFETLREMLAWGELWTQRVEHAPQQLRGSLRAPDADLHGRLGTALRALGFDTPVETGAFCGLYERADAVLICSSTDTHAPFIIEAAEAGKHIFCEKPIALDLGEIDRALAAVERNQVKLQIGFNRRFDSNFRHIHETVMSGQIGTPAGLLTLTSRRRIDSKP